MRVRLPQVDFTKGNTVSNTFFTSDHHFGHSGVCRFLRDDGSKLRPWDDPDEMDEALIANHNSVVTSRDKVYFLGDICIKRKSLEVLSRLNGDKVLIRGNHDIFKLGDYTKYFRDIRGTHKLESFILSHYPIHPDSFPSWCSGNIHGHTHYRGVLLPDGTVDTRYLNVSLENIDYTPISFEELRLRADPKP